MRRIPRPVARSPGHPLDMGVRFIETETRLLRKATRAWCRADDGRTLRLRASQLPGGSPGGGARTARHSRPTLGAGRANHE
jgi:hypothetical protein